MLWQQCLGQLEHEYSQQDINTWLRSLQAVEKPDVIYLLAPNPIVLQEVHETYLPRIIFHVQTLSGNHNYDVVLQVGSRPQEKKPPVQDTSTPPEHPGGKESTTSNVSEELRKRFNNNNLNTSMIFDNYVEGKSNQLARAASLQVGDNPGGDYNPLFIYGGVGLGKTHLMHAIGNRILQNHQGAHVIYIYAERFVNDMVNALRTNRMDDFKEYYRSADALLIDDIQFFAGKERSMEEFFHTFNSLLQDQKQIILTSDQYPRDVEGIDDRLRSRFNSGLTVEVKPPDLETRVAILRKKADTTQLHMPQDVAFFIAKRFRSNIRDLEGALQRVMASMRLCSINEMTLDFVHETLKDQLASQDKLVSIQNIKKTVAQHFNIRITDMDSKRRTRSVARPRQLAMALSKELTNHSLPEIGEDFGGRDHTTVLHACRKIAELIDSDPKMEEAYRILTRTLTN